MGWRRSLVYAGVFLLGIGLGGGSIYAVRDARLAATGPASAAPAVGGAVTSRPAMVDPKPSPLAKTFDFKGLLHTFFKPLRNPKSTISQNRDRRDEIGLSQTTCLGICFCKGSGHEQFVFENLAAAVKAEITAKGGAVDFRPGGIIYDKAGFWTGDYSVRHDGEYYGGTARIWCVADEEVPTLGQRFTVIITLDERGPEPAEPRAAPDRRGR